MMRSIAEIKLLPAFPVTAYPKVSKLLCALPDAASKVDVNTLQPEQAAVLAAMFPENSRGMTPFACWMRVRNRAGKIWKRSAKRWSRPSRS